MKKNIFILLLIVILTSCISPYKPQGIEKQNNILVVEGTITNGENVIRLSTSVDVDYYSTSTTYAYGELSIEVDDGTIHPLKYMSDGLYSTDMGTLDPEKKYRLNIKYNGDLYQSSFLHPLLTPAIDSIYYIKKETGSPVGIYVDTQDENAEIAYYMWTYREDWEFHVELFADADEKIINGEKVIIRYQLGTPNNLYYCWNYYESKGLILGSGNNTSGNIVKEKKILEKPASDDRWSSLYRIRLKQNAIRKEAHDYFSNLQKNTEQTGSIFLPLPAEIKGNIECITNPDIPVIGYIEVSSTVEKEEYVWGTENIHEPIDMECSAAISPFAEKLFRYDITGSLYAPAKCVHCTYGERGTKRRPENWPSKNY